MHIEYLQGFLRRKRITRVVPLSQPEPCLSKPEHSASFSVKFVVGLGGGYEGVRVFVCLYA